MRIRVRVGARNGVCIVELIFPVARGGAATPSFNENPSVLHGGSGNSGSNEVLRLFKFKL